MAIEEVSVEFKTETIYNFEVANHHNYAIDTHGYLVHNANQRWDKMKDAVRTGWGAFGWGKGPKAIDPKSTNQFGHTFGGRKYHHGQKMKESLLKVRAKTKNKQVGQFLDDAAAAPHILDVAKKGPGIHDVPIPNGVSARAFLHDGTEVLVDSLRVIVRPDGSIRTAYPFNSAYPN